MFVAVRLRTLSQTLKRIRGNGQSASPLKKPTYYMQDQFCPSNHYSLCFATHWVVTKDSIDLTYRFEKQPIGYSLSYASKVGSLLVTPVWLVRSLLQISMAVVCAQTLQMLENLHVRYINMSENTGLRCRQSWRSHFT